jgi:ankyrin repeat protein
MAGDVDILIECLCGRGWDSPVEPDLDRARALLDDAAVVAALDVYGAAAAGQVDVLRRHLATGRDAARRAGGPRGWPPLLYAAYSFVHQLEGRASGIVEATNLLLEHGADPDAAYFAADHDNGFSALYGTIAVTEDRARTDALLAAGASPSDGNSTFHAVESFDLDLLKALCAAGIETDDASYTIKHAIDMRWRAAVRLLLDSGAEPNAVHPGADETTLHWAVKRGAHRDVIEWLLAAGADPNLRTREGRAAILPILGFTPRDFAQRRGHVEAVELMDAAGAVASVATEAELFVFAVARGDEAGARALLAAEPGLMEQLPPEDRGLLPHWVQHGRRNAVSLACALGFSTAGEAWMGLPAVHWAALRGDPNMLRTLLDANAAIVDVGGYFGTPRHTAHSCQWYAEGDYEGVLELLDGASAGELDCPP